MSQFLFLKNLETNPSHAWQNPWDILTCNNSTTVTTIDAFRNLGKRRFGYGIIIDPMLLRQVSIICWVKNLWQKFAAKIFSEILILQLWNQTPFQTTTYFLHIYVVQGSQIWNEHVLTPSWLAVANITASAIGANDGKKILRPLPLAKSKRSFCPSAPSVND